MTRIKVIECGNCGCVFDPGKEDLHLYWMEGSYVDCPNCEAYNHTELQAVYKCDECGRVSKEDEQCNHQDVDVYERCHLCHGLIDIDFPTYKIVGKGWIHAYCKGKKERELRKNE